jgi:hypothetical protein
VVINFLTCRVKLKERFQFPREPLVIIRTRYCANAYKKRDVDMSKKSITVLGKPVDFVYIIKDVDVDKVRLEKYAAKCVGDIQSAWENIGTEQCTDQCEKTMEIILQESITTINLTARAAVIGIAAKNGGKIIKDFVTDRSKGGRKTYISELIFFKEAT